MASSIEYVDTSGLMLDLSLWLAWKNTDTLHLGHFPKLTKERWSWIVDNWNVFLFESFKNQANGDEYLENSLIELDNNVNGWRSGSKINPYENATFFSITEEFLETIKLDQLSLTNSERIHVNIEIQRVSKFTSETFRAMIRYLRTQRDLAFDLIGLGDKFYSERYAKRSLVAKQRNFFVGDLQQIGRIMDLENFILGILVEFKNTVEIEPNLLKFAQKQLSADSEADIRNIYQSSIVVPFERSLEQMAQDYLGNKLRWFDLVTVNGLKPPYVDISGEKASLLETASSNSLRISSNYADRARVGASVKVGSAAVPEEVRLVESVTDNLDGSVTLYLSGLNDLNRLAVTKKAYVRVFKPETVQDFSFVKIPFSVKSPMPGSPPPTLAALKSLDKALYAFGVDLAINVETGDIQISNDGDIKLQFGIPNIQQAVHNLLKTNVGQLPLHLNYGLPDSLGDNMTGGTTAAKIAVSVENIIKKDARFSIVNVSNIGFSPAGATMNLSVGVNGSTTLIPLSFEL